MELEGVRMRVDAMDGLRITQLRITLPEREPAVDDGRSSSGPDA